MQFRFSGYLALIMLVFSTLSFAQENPPVQLRPLQRPIKLEGLKVKPMRLLPPLVTKNYTRPEAPMSVQMVAAANRPATVQVIANFVGRIQYQKLLVYTNNLQQAVAAVDQSAALGQIPNDNANKLVALLNIISENIGGYLLADNNITEENLDLGATGSGLIVTPQGHVVTNAHVVAADEPSIRYKLLIGSIKNRSSELGNFLQGTYPQPNGMPQEAQQMLFSIMDQFYGNAYFNLVDVRGLYFVRTGNALQNASERTPATLIASGQPIPGKDVAVLKMNGVFTNLPTIAFGSDKELRPGDDIYVLGYPGVVDANDVLAKGVMREPSFTEGKMSARQQTSGGWEAIQVSAAVGHGNSGGPVFNKYGEVVGLLTFGSEDKSQPGSLIQGFNFIVPNTVVNEFIAEAGVTPEMSATSIKFREALQLQADEKFKKAVAALEEVQSSNSRFPYLDHELADARSKAAANSNWFLDIWDYMDTKTRILAGILALSALVWGGRKIFG